MAGHATELSWSLQVDSMRFAIRCDGIEGIVVAEIMGKSSRSDEVLLYAFRGSIKAVPTQLMGSACSLYSRNWLSTAGSQLHFRTNKRDYSRTMPMDKMSTAPR